jgi:hypothetical protein
MNKIILAFVLIACVSSTNITSWDVSGFFGGFCEPFGLETAFQELQVCFNQDIPDTENAFKQLLSDIEHKKWSNALGDILEALNAIVQLKKDCPAGVEPFIQTFKPVVEAFKGNAKGTVSQCGKNLANNAIGTVYDTYNTISDAIHHNCPQAGEAFGNLAQIAFSTWIPGTAVSGVASGESSFPSDDIFALVETNLEESNEGSTTEGSGTEFFEGFASAFGLQTAAQNLINCVEVEPNDLLSDIDALISDIQNSNWSGVISAGLKIYGDIQAMVSDCSDGANPFIAEFQPVFDAIQNNNTAFLETVGDNIKNNLGSVMGDLGQLIEDFNNSDYYDAGVEFGDIQLVTLKGILPNDTMTHHH